MCPKDFDRLKPQRQKAFSLLEVLVALGASAILLVTLTRFYKDSFRSYNNQEQVAERNQNAYYTLKTLTEMLQQAGSNLPDTGWNVISTSGSWLLIGENPGGVFDIVVSPGPALNKVPISDSALFSQGTHVLVDYTDPSKAMVKCKIVSLKKSLTGKDDTAFISPNLSVALDTGATVYSYKIDSVGIVSSNFVLGSTVLAENIDSLSLTFYDHSSPHIVTTLWKNIYSASIFVRARTSMPDPKYNATGGYRKLVDSMNVMLRNKKI